MQDHRAYEIQLRQLNALQEQGDTAERKLKDATDAVEVMKSMAHSTMVGNRQLKSATKLRSAHGLLKTQGDGDGNVVEDEGGAGEGSDVEICGRCGGSTYVVSLAC